MVENGKYQFRHSACFSLTRTDGHTRRTGGSEAKRLFRTGLALQAGCRGFESRLPLASFKGTACLTKMSIETLVSRYQLSARSQGLSEKTVEFILLGVKLFNSFMGGITDVRKVKGEDLQRFIIALQQRERWQGCPQNGKGRKLSPSSVNNYARAVRQFWSWLARDGIIKNNPLVLSCINQRNVV